MNGKISNIFAKSFGVRVCKTHDHLFDIGKHISIKEINADQIMFKINPVNIVADPFLYVNNDTLNLFYEEKINFNGKGVIKLTSTKNLNDWTSPRVVLKEKYHLSFPFVFKNGVDLFMIPETGADKSIRLYKPNSDLTEWIFYKKILAGCNYKDSSIYIKDGTLYLFTTICSENTFKLRLYFTDSLDETWVEHPNSPICTGGKNARNGGSVFSYKNELFRPAQNFENIYGGNLSIYKICELSKTGYHEILINEDIFPKHIPFYFLGGHHISYTYFQNVLIVATDGLQYDFNVFNLFLRLINALKGKIKSVATPINYIGFEF